MPRRPQRRGTCLPGVRWPFLCVCASVRVRFGVVVIVKVVVFIVGGDVAVVASWSEVACQWGLSGWKGRLLGTHKNDDNERQVVIHRVWLPCR